MAEAPTSNIYRLLFGGSTTQDHDSFEHDLDQLDEQRHQEQGARRPSAYVDVFEGMVETVLEHEHVLLSEQEIDALDYFRKFCYNTRYCLVRLVLRKPNQWHAISALQKLEKEVGEEGLRSSIEDLCKPINCPMCTSESNDSFVKRESTDADVPVKVEEDSREIIDLTFDTEEEKYDQEDCGPVNVPMACAYNAEAGPSRLPTVPTDPVKAILQSNPAEMNLSFFCEDESNMTLEDILWRLNRDQLLELVKSTRCKLPSKSKKADIIASLQRTAASQSILTSMSPIRNGKGKGKGRDDGLHHSTLPFLSIGKLSRTGKLKMTQEHRLRQMALKLLGKCVRVNFDFYRLVRRINIICYREKEYPDSLMLPALLTVFKKRNYPAYEHTRDSNIWTSREDLLEYEKALEAEKALEQIMETPIDTDSRSATKTPGCGRDEFMTPVPRRAFTTPLKTPGSVADIDSSETPRMKKEEETDQTCLGVNEPETEEQTVTAIPKDQKMVNCLRDSIFPKWQELLSIREAQTSQSRSAALERFETGYVYTRMVDKATRSLGPLKEYDDELMILNCLLDQKYWRRGKRADWYVRRAIIQNHLWLRDKDDKLLWNSLQCIKDALSDEDTGSIWRPNLELRRGKLEKRLKIPEADRLVYDSQLQKPQIIEVRAVRVHPTKFDSHGHPINEKEGNSSEAGLHSYMSVTKKDSSEEKKLKAPNPVKKKLGQKSSWKGRGDQIVNVETRALEHYEDLGFKGFHCETRILTTLFALLFWDVMFANIPGALETPFQDAPLDLCEDTFYYARKDLIEARLAEIRDGKGPEILQQYDEKHREKETWCVGLSWDLCEREDLVDIAKCLGGKSLSTICKLFCEDYKGRRSGGPDLFLWKAEQRLCKFVEVKGPGDTPQENQKLWFDALLGANAAVEICKVIDVTNNPTRGKKRKAKTPASPSRRNKIPQSLDFNSEEENYDRLDPSQESEFYSKDDLYTRPGKRQRLTKNMDDVDDLSVALQPMPSLLSPSIPRHFH